MRRFAPIAAALFALASLQASPALAQGKKKPKTTNEEDAPIPYPDEEEESPGRRDLPRKSDATPDVREESDDEKAQREESLASLDDPSIGLSGELVSGLVLMDSSKGAFAEGRFLWGLRFTWEWGRVLADEWMRERLFADVTWSYSTLHDGTTKLFTDSNFHYFTVAPAFAFPFGEKSAFAAYVQVGGGITYEFASQHVDKAETQIGGTKPTLQYGVGIRGRPVLIGDEETAKREGERVIRLSFRLEATRLMRQYMTDTLLGGSIGATF